MSKIHVLPDENLGGGPNGQILREYVEVDRPAKEDDLIIFRDDGYDITAGRPYRVIDSRSYANLVIFIDDADERHGCGKLSERFFVIEPTDIVHIDGTRYRLVDRKAKVGEKVIIVETHPSLVYTELGEIVEIIETDGDTCGGMFKPHDIGEKGAVYHFQYRVLEPVEPAEAKSDLEGDDVLTVDETEVPKSVIDLLANLAWRVTELERKLGETNKSQESSETHIFDVIHRIQNEIDGMYDKYREVDDKIEMILDDIVTLDERTQPLVALAKAMKGDE